eukprot:TRINITY_DN3276_c0_g1_i1.p1 TRINITY_DN3276_c0_g1~~TRINITY_DN3276_c0_g1_i1.p1  ORF type:complete len:335 (-),score=132.22 TRINITY_DN3276_c0_g1_i1:123-1127(-)
MSEQNADSSLFSSNFLGAFPTLATKTELNLQIVKDVAEFYRARAKIEDEYAKKLAALYKNPPGAGGGFFGSKEPPIMKEYKSLKESFNSVSEKGLKTAEAHQEIANKINNDVCKTLDTFVKVKSNDRAKLVMDGQKQLKSLADSKANVQKAKSEYEKFSKETDLAKEALLKAEKDEKAAPDNKKFPPITKKASEKYIQTREKAKSLEVVYQSAVKKFNEDLDSHKSEKLPTIISSVQKWEEERWNLILASIQNYKNAQENISETYSKNISEINTEANLSDDFTEYSDVNKKADAEEHLEFVAFKSKFEEDNKPEEKPTEEKKEEAPKEEEKMQK